MTTRYSKLFPNGPQYHYMASLSGSTFSAGVLPALFPDDVNAGIYANAITNPQDSFGDDEEDGEPGVRVVAEDFALVRHGGLTNFGFGFGEIRADGGSETIYESLSGGLGVPQTFLETFIPPEEGNKLIDLPGQTDAAVEELQEFYDESDENSPRTLAHVYFAAQELIDILDDPDVAAIFEGEVTLQGVIDLIILSLENVQKTSGALIDAVDELTGLNGNEGFTDIAYGTSFTGFLPIITIPAGDNASIVQIVYQLHDIFTINGIENLADDKDFDFHVIDYGATIGAIFDDPSNFNILSVTDTLRASPVPGAELAPTSLGFIFVNPLTGTPYDPDQILWHDPAHPIANTHDMLGVVSAYTLGDGKQVDFLSDFSNFFVDFAFFSRTDNLIFAQDGNDTVFAGNGIDIVYGGLGADYLEGGQHDDVLAGGSGDDSLYGGSGLDVISGNDGDDSLSGNRHADALFDMLGSDVAWGDQGNDLLYHVDEVLIGGEAENTDFDVFNGGSGNDLVIIAIDGEDSARVAEVVAELESEIGFVANAPDATLDTLGLELNGVERVVLFDGRGFGTVAEMEALGISSALAEQLVLADYAMVGVPLLGLEGPSVLFDSAEI